MMCGCELETNVNLPRSLNLQRVEPRFEPRSTTLSFEIKLCMIEVSKNAEKPLAATSLGGGGGAPLNN